MPTIAVVVSVDWEGRSLLPENLEIVAAFRRKHPDVPMQHFLNAAYYTRPGVNAAQTTDSIRQALMPRDEHGMHIHAWHSLLAAAGVEPRSEPRFLEGGAPIPKASDDWDFYPPEGGYDVPLEDFTGAELDRVVRTSSEILVSQGFHRPTTFRAGGWVAGERVHASLARNGFLLDCSAVNPQVPLRRFGDIPLCRRLAELWSGIDETSQPYRLSTSSGEIWEVPNNAALVDYISSEELCEIFRRNVESLREEPTAFRIVSIGFHQETARKFLNRLDEAIDVMRRLADEHRLELTFAAQPESLFA